MTDRIGRLLTDHLPSVPAPVGSNHRKTKQTRETKMFETMLISLSYMITTAALTVTVMSVVGYVCVKYIFK
jgi:hypothetical protein